MLLGVGKEFYRVVVLAIFTLILSACSDGGSGNSGNTNEKPSPVITSFSAAELIITIGQSTDITPVFFNGEGVVDNDLGVVASGTSISVNPVSTTTYTLTVSDEDGNSVEQQLTITVVPPPVISSFTASRLTITDGNVVTLTPVFSDGVGTIDNDVGIVNSADNIDLSPSITTIYTLSVVNSAGSVVSQQITITVVPPPVISGFTASVPAITNGNSVMLTPVFSGGTGSIDNGVGAVDSAEGVVVSPSTTTTYLLSVDNGAGTVVQQEVSITVAPPSVISGFTASQSTITSGHSATLTPVFSGGVGTIDNGVGIINSTQPVNVAPDATTTYTLTVDNSLGSVASQEVTIFVVPAPVITSFAASEITVTSGDSVRITSVFFDGAGTIDNGIGPVNSTEVVTVNPTTTTTYTLSVDNGVGGVVNRQLTITVLPLPVITSFTASELTITSGNSVTLTPEFTGGTGAIDNGIGAVNSLGAVEVNPTTTTTYTLTVDNGVGGIVSREIVISVLPMPVITSFVASQLTITNGDSVTLTPEFSDGTGTIDNGVGSVNTTEGVSVNPAVTTTYTLTVDNGAGGIVTSDIIITVLPMPVITSFTASELTILSGDSVTLTPLFTDGEGTIDNGVGVVNSSEGIIVNPTSTTTYTLTVDNGAGGVVMEQATISVVGFPAITSFTASQLTITNGNSATIIPVFSDGVGSIDNGIGAVNSGEGVIVSPTATTTYTLTVDNGIGNSVEEQISITVVPPPVITSFTASQSSVESGGNVTLIPVFSGGEASIDHDVGVVNSNDNVIVNPLLTTTYSLTVDNGFGGIVSEQVTIAVGQVLNDTGTTQCYNNTGVVACSSLAFPGQDADLGFDADANDNSDGQAGFVFTKLDANGNPLPATATSWSCVRDERTNLVWEVKLPTPGNLHSSGNTYSWYSSDSTNNSGNPGTMDGGSCTGSLCDTESFVAAVNTEELCGFNDWRMPDRAELNSIVRVVPSSLDAPLDPQYFPYHGSNRNYWSGTSPGWSSTIGISGGSANYLARLGFGYLPKVNTFRARLVRGNRWDSPENVAAQYDQTCQTETVRATTPNSRFIDNNDGTVTDIQTNLTWARCPIGKVWDGATNFCAGAANSYTWQQALQAVVSLNNSGAINGYTDWRLPNYKELVSISEAQCVQPSVNLEVFPIWNASNIYVFWSSTTVMSNPERAFRMELNSAFVSSLNKTSSQQILLVRDAIQ